MKTSFLIIICKIVTFIGHLIGRNMSVFPGKLAYDRDIRILSKVKYPKMVIGVTGSSGKGSTIEIIEHILVNAGYTVARNKYGSNGIYGITTLILNNTKVFSKKPKKEIYLMEIDERHIKLAFLKPTLTHLVVTNLTRDQVARNGSPESIYNDIFNVTYDSTHLVINSDDALVHRIKTTFKGEITTYGIAKTNDSYLDFSLNNDACYCPICNTKLIYDYYHYGHLGSYHCPNKDFKRGKVDYEAHDLNLEKKEMFINQQKVCLNKDILYSAYATLAAYSLCKVLNIDDKIILNCLNDNQLKPKRGNVYTFHERQFNMLESKNENALSYYQSLEFIVKQKGLKTVILGFDNVSRRYKYNDLAWLYDVNFEKLNNKDIDHILCIGKFKYDVATRLMFAGIEQKKLILIDDINNLLKEIDEQTKGNIYTMVCFDKTAEIKKLLGGKV